jgi:hypothetical protein
MTEMDKEKRKVVEDTDLAARTLSETSKRLSEVDSKTCETEQLKNAK